jgi:hypothetical protein
VPEKRTVLMTSAMLLCGALTVYAANGPAVPATIHYLTQVVDGNGSVQDQDTSTMYIRADGATVTIAQRPWTGPATAGVDKFERWLIIDGSRQISVYPVLRMKTTLPIPQGRVGELLLHSSAYCGAGVVALDGEILGNAVYRISAGNLDGGQAPQLRSTVWRAPALGCAQLRSVTEIVDATGTVIGKTVKEATSITLGEAGSGRFSVPAEYAEASPSQTRAALAALKGKPCPECERNTAAQADANYFRHRAAGPH